MNCQIVSNPALDAAVAVLTIRAVINNDAGSERISDFLHLLRKHLQITLWVEEVNETVRQRFVFVSMFDQGERYWPLVI